VSFFRGNTYLRDILGYVYCQICGTNVSHEFLLGNQVYTGLVATATQQRPSLHATPNRTTAATPSTTTRTQPPHRQPTTKPTDNDNKPSDRTNRDRHQTINRRTATDINQPTDRQPSETKRKARESPHRQICQPKKQVHKKRSSTKIALV
jgi:hypothetical protein